MWTVGSRRGSFLKPSPILFFLLILIVGFAGAGTWAADQQQTPPSVVVSEERAELFVERLRQRAQELVARRRRPKATPTTSASLIQGYESNVALDGKKEGDFYTQETLSLLLQPQFTPWLRGRLAYELFNHHYAELRDFNIWMNTLTAILQFLPHPRTGVEALYEYSIVNFPFNTTNGFFDARVSLAWLFAQTGWLVHRTTWMYQLRDFDTREAGDTFGNPVPSVVREDQRHVLRHEIRLRLAKTSASLVGEYYRNLSNDQSQKFYDWDNYQVRGILARDLSTRWLGIASVGYERREYQERQVPAIGTTERDDLYTLAGSLVYHFTEHVQGRYSMIWRYQDSNDPRLDFTDWINEAGVTLTF